MLEINERNVGHINGLRVLSLFDGISCGRLALDRAGIPVIRYVAYEINAGAIKISRKNFPEIEQMGDVCTADFTQYEGFDLLIAGSPCQSLSIIKSKTREKLEGKSKLFFEFVRALREVKPKYFLFENVASMDKESMDTISDLLGCKPMFIDSKLFSAQQRPRLYWTNILSDYGHITACGDAVLKDIMLAEDDVPEKYWYDKEITEIDMSKQVCGKLMINIHDMHKRLFNPEFKCHTLTCVSGGNQQKKVLTYKTTGDKKVLKARKLLPVEYERLQTLPDGYTDCVCDSKRYSCIGNGWTVDVIAYLLAPINVTNKNGE